MKRTREIHLIITAALASAFALVTSLIISYISCVYLFVYTLLVLAIVFNTMCGPEKSDITEEEDEDEEDEVEEDSADNDEEDTAE